jgi:hypothetical protein
MVRGPGEAFAAAWLADGELAVTRDGARALLGDATEFALTDDTLRPAALVVLRNGDGPLQFTRVPFDSETTYDTLGLVWEIPDEPLSVVTNETEALVPLEGGRIGIQPLSGTAFRVLPPPEEGIERLRIVLRANASFGGAAYVVDVGDEEALRFAPLVCNR